MLQSKRIACCIILLLGMTLPAEAHWFNMKNAQGKESYKDKPFWSVITLLTLIATIVLAVCLTIDDGGNSQFLLVMGIAAFGSFTLGSILHYKIAGSNNEQVEEYNKYVETELGRSDSRARYVRDKSKWVLLGAWFVGIMAVSIYFLAQGNGAFNFMGGEQVVGAEINMWLVAALGVGLAGLTVSGLIAGCAWRGQNMYEELQKHKTYPSNGMYTVSANTHASANQQPVFISRRRMRRLTQCELTGSA